MARDALDRAMDNLHQDEADCNRNWVYVRTQLAYALGRLKIAQKLAADEDTRRLREQAGKLE
jgi:hypothetical protein